ncbi:MAG TPA: FKBP-type peptidyl-prolyl cis-trans isomerase [Longimicrobiaceae bacterium]
MKLKTWFAAASLAVLAACGTDSPTFSLNIGPPPELPAGTDTVTTSSGLKYADIIVGTGAEAHVGDQVQVHYIAWLANGTGFDTSHGGNPYVFTIGAGNTLEGFDEGVRGMKVGGRRRLIIPPSLGYGNVVQTDGSGRVVVPANSTLIFDVDLVSVQ